MPGDGDGVGQPGGGYVVVEYAPALALSGLEVDMAEGALADAEVLYSLDAQDWQPLPEDLEANPVTRNIPVIAISANVLAETMTRGQSSGFHGYLTKPISIGALVSAIQDATAPTFEGGALTA